MKYFKLIIPIPFLISIFCCLQGILAFTQPLMTDIRKTLTEFYTFMQIPPELIEMLLEGVNPASAIMTGVSLIGCSAVIAIIGLGMCFLFWWRKRTLTEAEPISDAASQVAFQTYFDQLIKLFLEVEQHSQETAAKTKDTLRTQTLLTLQKLNLTWRDKLIRFLQEAKLMTTRSSIDLSRVSLSQNDLSDVDLNSVYLTGGRLIGTDAATAQVETDSLNPRLLKSIGWILLIGTTFCGLWSILVGLTQLTPVPKWAFGITTSLGDALYGTLLFLTFAIVIGVGAIYIWILIFQEQRLQTAHQVTTDRLREITLQDYLDRMTNLTPILQTSRSNIPIKHIAQARTLMVLRDLDEKRKQPLLRLLYEAGLITDQALVSLYGADLSDIDLSEADLTGVDLTGANLSRAKLRAVTLTRANLTNVDLTDANLWKADLSGVNLTKATIVPDQLAVVRSLKGSILPDGTRQP